MIKTYSKLFIASFLILLCCLGFGRFAFGMIIPNMQADLNISTTTIGFISSANFLGYFIGIIFSSKIYSLFKTSKLIRSLMIIQGFAMLLMCFFSNYYLLSSLYLISGFMSAVANISIMVYISHAVPKKIRGKALGIAVSGNGLAIILSGFLVPYFENFYSYDSWRITWAIFAISLIVVAFIMTSLLTYNVDNSVKSESKFYQYINNKKFWQISTLYFLFGITYVVYMTYFVSASIIKWDLSSEVSGQFWSLFGFICMFGGFIFGSIADKYGTFKTIVLVLFCQSFAIFILIFDIPSYALFISVLFFAISVWSVPTMISMLSTEYFGLNKTAQVFSLATLIFAIGQTIGPATAGYIYDLTSSYDIVFLITFIFSFLAFVLSLIFSYKKIDI